jgi:hypothetical protein
MSSPAQASPYAKFEYRPGVTEDYDVVDYNGVLLYDNQPSLFCAIIENDDTAMLNQYLTKYPLTPLKWNTSSQNDPYLKAAAYGSTDVLRELLERRVSRPDLAPEIATEMELSCSGRPALMPESIRCASYWMKGSISAMYTLESGIFIASAGMERRLCSQPQDRFLGGRVVVRYLMFPSIWLGASN